MKEGVPYSLIDTPVYRKIILAVMGETTFLYIRNGKILMTEHQKEQIENLIKIMEE
jgi:hypothetical protein